MLVAASRFHSGFPFWWRHAAFFVVLRFGGGLPPSQWLPMLAAAARLYCGHSRWRRPPAYMNECNGSHVVSLHVAALEPLCV